jgi:hypothetical protein
MDCQRFVSKHVVCSVVLHLDALAAAVAELVAALTSLLLPVAWQMRSQQRLAGSCRA